MRILHSLGAGLRSATSILSWLLAFPLLFLGTGLVLVQPCAGQTWTATGSLNTARWGHTVTLLPNGKVLAAGAPPPPRPPARFKRQAQLSRERGTVRSGERNLDGDRQPRHRTQVAHGDVATQR